MLHPNHLSVLLIIITGLIITLFHIPTSFSQVINQSYVDCGRNFVCGNIDVGYPFSGGNRPIYCGYPGFNLTCIEGDTFLASGPLTYQVFVANVATQSLTVARNDIENDFVSSNTCQEVVYSDTFNLNIFKYSSNVQNLSLFYGCTSLIGIPTANQFFCTATNGTEINNYFATSTSLGFNTGLVSCDSTIVVRVFQNSNLGNYALLYEGIRGGFGLQWDANNTICDNCIQSGGRCGYNSVSASFACYCTDRTYDLTCNDTSTSSPNGPGSSGNSIKIILAVVGAVIAGVGLGWLIFYCRQRRKKRVVNHLSSIDKKEHPTTPLTYTNLNTPSSIASTTSTSSYASSKTEVGMYSSYFGAKIFTYNELEEATGNFDQTRELGDGGFGAVYHGILSDGSIVAVKRLYENNYKRVEQFMNEVKILSQLRHTHLVTLYGCTSKQSRELLLVYEYIPNGTIADHLQGKRANSGLLSWPIRLNIAIETADALAYLHASDIIHRDVKSNNILLDNDFHVKVADFGLSRLFPNDVTHVSTAPQGTPGYVDPEYYQVYQLTEKSDVYSFGVVLMELISALPAVDITRHRLDINLANMAVTKIQSQTLHEIVDPSLPFETNSTVRKMITLVAELAFRCLQQEKGMRPSMQEVLDELRGIQKAEIVDILVDDGKLLKDNSSPPSPKSVTYKWISGSTRSPSG